MPDIEAALYVPAFSALVATILALVGAIKILYSRNVFLVDQIRDLQAKMVAESVRVITLNSEALKASTDALGRLATNVRSQTAGTVKRNREP